MPRAACLPGVLFPMMAGMLDVSPTKYGHGAATLPAGTRVMADIAAVLGGSLLVALCAQIRIPLPLLGGWRGPAAVAAYLLQGAFGLPFFAGGAAGWATLAGPTGGYLVGFFAAAVLIPAILGRGADGPARIVAALVAGNVAIYLFGVPWLDRFVDGRLLTAVNLGLTPFLIGDAIKLLAAALVVVAAGSSRRLPQR